MFEEYTGPVTAITLLSYRGVLRLLTCFLAYLIPTILMTIDELNGTEWMVSMDKCLDEYIPQIELVSFHGDGIVLIEHTEYKYTELNGNVIIERELLEHDAYDNNMYYYDIYFIDDTLSGQVYRIENTGTDEGGYWYRNNRRYEYEKKVISNFHDKLYRNADGAYTEVGRSINRKRIIRYRAGNGIRQEPFNFTRYDGTKGFKLGGDLIRIYGLYHPYYDGNNPKHDTFSRHILELKWNNMNSVDYFFEKIKNYFTSDFTIVIIPSHNPEKTVSGVTSLAVRLAKHLPYVTDGTKCLIRHVKVPKISAGGSRDIEVHMQSLRVVNTDLIRDKAVLLIDDVTTTNNSLRAGMRLLLEAGASHVECFALGRTYKETRKRGFRDENYWGD